jgi:large subunit ribosomal protein L31e
MAEKKEQPALERSYTVPLRKGFINAPPYRKALRAVKTLREFLARHMKSADVRLGQHVNQYLWSRGIKNPPPRVKVHAVKDGEGVVRAELEGKPYKESVRSTPKEEKPETLKERLTGRLGRKERTAEPEEVAVEKKAEEEAAPTKTEPTSGPKPTVKAEAKPPVKPASEKKE